MRRSVKDVEPFAILLQKNVGFCVIYICKKSSRMTAKGIVIALISGLMGHIGLGSCYVFAIAGLPNVVLAADVIVSFIPIIATWLLCKIFKVEFS